MTDGNGGIFHESIEEGWYDVAGVNAEGIADEARVLYQKWQGTLFRGFGLTNIQKYAKIT